MGSNELRVQRGFFGIVFELRGETLFRCEHPDGAIKPFTHQSLEAGSMLLGLQCGAEQCAHGLRGLRVLPHREIRVKEVGCGSAFGCGVHQRLDGPLAALDHGFVEETLFVAEKVTDHCDVDARTISDRP